MSTSAAEVITQHAQLTAAWRQPSNLLISYVRNFSADVVRRRGAAAAERMFYPLFSDAARDYERWVTLAGRDLFSARVFQVTAEMCAVTNEIYRKSTESTTRISYEELPAERGFVWLDDPAALRDRIGKVIRLRAVSWAPLVLPSTDGGGTLAGVRLMLWADARVTDDYSARYLPGVLQRSERQFGRLQLMHTHTLPMDVAMLAATDTRAGVSDNDVMWLHALFMLIGTEICVTSRARLPASTKGALRRTAKHPEVTIVTLRRGTRDVSGDGASDDDGVATGTAVEWRHRWVVQGHHRHIEAYDGESHHATPQQEDRGVCVICTQRITWVRPHVKGPDGLSFKTDSGSVIYRLRR